MKAVKLRAGDEHGSSAYTNLLSFSFTRQSTSVLFKALSNHKKTELILLGLAKIVALLTLEVLTLQQFALKLNVNVVFSLC